MSDDNGLGIILKSKEHSLRELVKSTLLALSENRDLKILDCGGGINSWLGDLVTHVMDLSADPLLSTKIVGDVCDGDTWAELDDKEFDFVNCTHTLEDIRDPQSVIYQMSRVAKAGFIAVPSADQEFTFLQSKGYLGYGHHRWIFKVIGAKLSAWPKFPAISSPQMAVRKSFIKRPKLIKIVNEFPLRLISKVISKVVKKKVTKNVELGLIWINSCDFYYFNMDFAGRSVEELISKTIEFLEIEENDNFIEGQSLDLYQILSESFDKTEK